MTNPPFGASKNEGIDSSFIKLASEISEGPVYVIHKSACRDFLGKFAGTIDRDFQVLWEFSFEVPYIRFEGEDLREWVKKDSKQKNKSKNRKLKGVKHKKDVGYVECDLMRFIKFKPQLEGEKESSGEDQPSSSDD